MKTVESIPNAERTFKALRSLGYGLSSSVADIIDNSISAAANEIQVTFKRKKNKFICRILDNGIGMDSKLLEECMRIGTETVYGEHDLGKFGMGMKTASLSHCNKLSVLSKKRNSKETCFIWDMEHVRGAKSWELLQLSEKEIKNLIKKEKIRMPPNGTFVCWDGMLLLDKEYDSYKIEKFAQNFYFKILGDLKIHLSMLFHRYLEENDMCDNISIYVNGDRIKPWDLFCEQEEATEKVELSEDIANLEVVKKSKPVLIKGYILPAKEQFSSEKSWKAAKGSLSWNDAQGYYLYRNHRLIRYGGWHGTKAKDEHDKLARISIDIDSSLDEFFRITVNKSKVQFPEVLVQHLKKKVNPIVVNKAEKRYRNTGEKKSSEESTGKQPVPTGKGTMAKKAISGTFAGNDERTKEDLFYRVCRKGKYEVIPREISSELFWEISWERNKKLLIILNKNHGFYKNVYCKAKDKVSLDILIFSLAFSEFFHRNVSTADLLNAFKDTFSKILGKAVFKVGL